MQQGIHCQRDWAYKPPCQSRAVQSGTVFAKWRTPRYSWCAMLQTVASLDHSSRRTNQSMLCMAVKASRPGTTLLIWITSPYLQKCDRTCWHTPPKRCRECSPNILSRNGQFNDHDQYASKFDVIYRSPTDTSSKNT